MKEIKIMEDKGPWVFTEEQIKKIKNFSAEDISKFYNDNYEIILHMAKKFICQAVGKGLYCYDIEDLMHQVYVDMPYYSFKSRSALYMSIVRASFRYINYGGYKARNNGIPEDQINSFAINNEDEKDLLLDFKSSYEEIFFNFENPIKDREEKDKKIIEYLEKTISDPKVLNAMFCKLFTDIPQSEIKGDEYAYYKQCEKQNK